MIMGSGGGVDSGGQGRGKQKRARGHAGPHRQDKVKAKSSGWRARDGEKEDERGAKHAAGGTGGSKEEEFKRSAVG
jgi:hypothetical protein